MEAPFPVKAYALLDGSSDGFPPVTMRAPFVTASEMLLATPRGYVHEVFADTLVNTGAAFGFALTASGATVSVVGGQRGAAQQLRVPGDFSSAAFWMVAAAALPGSRYCGLPAHQALADTDSDYLVPPDGDGADAEPEPEPAAEAEPATAEAPEPSAQSPETEAIGDGADPEPAPEPVPETTAENQLEPNRGEG